MAFQSGPARSRIFRLDERVSFGQSRASHKCHHIHTIRKHAFVVHVLIESRATLARQLSRAL